MSGPAANAGSSANEGATERLRWRGFWGRLVIAVVIASACMTSAVALVDRGITDRVAEDPARSSVSQLAPAPPGGANYLIIGSDTRAFVDNSGDAAAFGDPNNPDDSVEGQRSDTLMVAHVEPSAQRTFVVSFPRDLMVDMPGARRAQHDQLRLLDRAAHRLVHRHAQGQLRHRHQPLPRGRLPELQGDRQRDRQRQGVPARARSATSSSGC